MANQPVLLLVEPDRSLRQELRSVLEAQSDVYVVDAGSVDRALSAVDREQPAVALVAMSPDATESAASLRRLTRRYRGLHVVGMSCFWESDTLPQPACDGYLLKPFAISELLDAIEPWTR